MANLVVIVGFMVTVTSGLPDAEQGLGTGLATMSQQVGITMGTPVMSGIVTAFLAGAATPAAIADAVSIAIGVNAALCLATAAFVAVVLPRGDRGRHA